MLKKFTEILEFIKHQVDIDLFPIVEYTSNKKSHINVDLSKLSALQIATLYRFAHSSKRFDLQDNGGFGYTLLATSPVHINSGLVNGII